MFDWNDYYGTTDDEEGVVGYYGLMGSGNHRADRPAQVMAYHKLKEGWVSGKTIGSSDIDTGETETTFLPYAGDSDTVSPDHRAVKYDGSSWTDVTIFDTYYVEARDPPNDGLPEQPDNYPGTDSGLLVYGADGEIVNLVQTTTQTDVEDRPDEPTIPSENYTAAVHDPDLNVAIGLAQDPRAPDDGLSVNVSKVDSSNYQGINVYSRVDCTNITGTANSLLDSCDNVQASSYPENATTPRVGVLAHTDNGTTGVTANGTVVNEIPGGTVINAGTMKKVYVPRNRSVQFEVDASDVPAATNVSVTSQTVTRDENGERVASTLDNETVTGGQRIEPETARLSVTPDEWDAGQHRTLAGNETELSVQNTGVSAATNVSITTDSDLVEVSHGDVETLEPTEWHNESLSVQVPGGKPVGTYTANVTVTGEGTTGPINETVRVRVDVLPTARWETGETEVRRNLTTNETVDVNVTVANSESSNVPLRDLETVVDGNVTRFDVEPPRFVETLERGEQTTLTTTVRVPEDGIQEGSYNGTVSVDPLLEYADHFEYPVEVPDGYVVPAPENATVDVDVVAHGPSANSSAEFHPERQVAMRRGVSTQRVTVDVVNETHDVPTESVAVRSDIPDGWSFQGNNPEKQTKVWIVANTSRDTPGGQAGERVRLKPDEYDVTVSDGQVVLRIDDVAATSYGQYMSAADVLEFEFRLNKQTRADEYEYAATVDVETQSPVRVVRFERPVAAIDVFDPRPGTADERVSNGHNRVPRGAVSLDANADGTDGTLVAQEYYRIRGNDGESEWVRFRLESNGTDQTVRTVFLPVNRSNGTVQLPVKEVDDGAIVLPGVVTMNIQGAVSSSLRNGAVIDMVIDDANADSDLNSLSPAVNESRLQLVSVDGSVRIDVGERPEDDDPDFEIPVTIGQSVFDAPVTGGPPERAPN